MPDWTAHCPIDEDEWPVLRQAWHAGWINRMETGPGKPDREIGLRLIDEPHRLSAWLQGYSAADNVQRQD